MQTRRQPKPPPARPWLRPTACGSSPPEYNYSYPGVLKNLLDWLSRPLEPFPAESASVMVGKKVALSAAAGQSAGAGTLAKLNEVLGFGKTELLPTDKQVGVALAPEAWGHRQAHPVR